MILQSPSQKSKTMATKGARSCKWSLASGGAVKGHRYVACGVTWHAALVSDVARLFTHYIPDSLTLIAHTTPSCGPATVLWHREHHSCERTHWQRADGCIRSPPDRTLTGKEKKARLCSRDKNAHKSGRHKGRQAKRARASRVTWSRAVGSEDSGHCVQIRPF